MSLQHTWFSYVLSCIYISLVPYKGGRGAMLVKKNKKKETSLGNLELPQQVFQGRNKRKEARTQAHRFRFYRQIKEIGKHTIDKRGIPYKADETQCSTSSLVSFLLPVEGGMACHVCSLCITRAVGNLKYLILLVIVFKSICWVCS